MRSIPSARRARWYGWWYVCIGLGFGLLGLRSFLAGTGFWAVALRWLIAVGFIALGVGTLRAAAQLATLATRRDRQVDPGDSR